MPQITNHAKSLILSRPVSELVPHSEPMVLIDRIVDFDLNSLTAEFDIDEHSRFYNAKLQGIESWIGIEYMAQSIAALAGIRALLNKQKVKLGFLLGTRKLILEQSLLPINTGYRVQVKELFMDDSGLGAFQCSIGYRESLICEAKLNVFETQDASQLLKKENN